MSTPEFNPMPDQLQQPSGSPEQDVLAPPGQAPAAAAPAPMPPSPDQGGPVPSSSAAPAQQDNPETHGWRAVLKGALSALEQHAKGAGEGFVVGGLKGAAIGAVNPNLAETRYNEQNQLAAGKVQQQQAQVKFANAEAAAQIADAHLRDAQREQMPAELQLRRDEIEGNQARMWIQMGVLPKVVADNTDDGAHAGLQQLQNSNGGAVPPMVYLHVGDQHLAFDPSELAANSGVLKDVNNYQRITGGQQFPNTLLLNKQPNKTQILQAAATIFSPVSPGKDLKASNAQVNQYQGYINNVKAWPDDTPDKAQTLSKLQAAYKLVKDAHDKNFAEDVAKAQARGAAAQNAKAVEVVDPNTNTAHFVSAGEAKAQGLTSAATASKSEAKIAQLQDMQTGSQNARQAIQKLGTNLTPATSLKVQAALRSGDEGYINKTRDSILASGLPQDQQDFVNSLLNLQERALSLRSIGGQGQGSESQRNAVINLLPGIKDLGNRQLMLKKLDAFDQQVGIYYKNVPKANVKTQAAPAATAAPTNAPVTSTDPFAAFGGKSRAQGGQ